MRSLKELCLVKCFETVCNGSLKLNLRKLPKTLRQELMAQLFASAPPVLDHFRVVNLIPIDFAWRECQYMLHSYRFTYGLFYSAHMFKRMLVNYGVTVQDYTDLAKLFKKNLYVVLTKRLGYSIEFFRKDAEEIKFNGRILELREDAGPVPHAVGEIMPFWQTGPRGRGGITCKEGLYPIWFEGNLRIMHIVLTIRYYDIFRYISVSYRIELRPDPEITRGVDALILDKITKPSIHPVW